MSSCSTYKRVTPPSGRCLLHISRRVEDREIGTYNGMTCSPSVAEKKARVGAGAFLGGPNDCTLLNLPTVFFSFC